MKTRRGEDPRLAWDDILLFHILPKLPVKSLFRFKCVCKEWRRWISRDPIFIREQSRSSLSSPGVVVNMGFGGLEFLPIKGVQTDVPDPSLKFLKGSRPCLEAACNGLLCLSFLQSWCRRKFYVCNPVTKEWSWIHGAQCRNFFGLAFDPLYSPLVYKLVCLRPDNLGYIRKCKEIQFEVFSSDTRVWTMSGKRVATKSCELSFSKSMFAGGVLYWDVETQFIWFDTRRDLAGALMLPPGRDTSSRNYALGVWKDRLTYSEFMCGKMEAWIMSEFKWKRICKVKFDNAVRVNNSMDYLVRWAERRMLPYQGGQFLYFTVKDGISVDVICYNMKTREVTQSSACGKNSYGRRFFTYNSIFVPLPKSSKHMSKRN